MKILYLLYSFTTGGTERLVCDICNQMADRGHDVHLYVVNDLYDHSMLDSLNVNVHVFLQNRKCGGGDKLKTLTKVASYIRKHKIQVVHCNSLDAPELLMLKPVSFPKVQILYTVHGLQQMRTKSGWKIKYINLICDHIIAISDCVKEDIIAAGITPKKVVTVPNAIDFSKFPTQGKQGYNPLYPVVGNVARIQPHVKGQDVLIRAIAIVKQAHPNIRCLFAGTYAPGHQEELEQLHALVEQLGLSEQVAFVGNVQDVAGFLSQLDVFVLPSRSEGFGISLVEAMSMGIPCLASRLDGPQEVLQGGKYGNLFTCDDPQDLAQRLLDMLSNYDKCKQLALDANCHVRTQYAIEQMCNRLEALMKDS